MINPSAFASLVNEFPDEDQRIIERAVSTADREEILAAIAAACIRLVRAGHVKRSRRNQKPGPRVLELAELLAVPLHETTWGEARDRDDDAPEDEDTDVQRPSKWKFQRDRLKGSPT